MDELTVIGEVVEEGIWMEKEDEWRKIKQYFRKVTEYKIGHCICPCCRKEVFANDPGCPRLSTWRQNR